MNISYILKLYTLDLGFQYELMEPGVKKVYRPKPGMQDMGVLKLLQYSHFLRQSGIIEIMFNKNE